MFAYSHFHSKYLANRLTLEGLGEEALAASLSTARVDMKPHQVEAALFALRSPLQRGAILADEVGLGKTIEASLVIAQRWAERRRRILLIVPASLRKQWSQELWDKFALPSVILDAKTAREAVKAGVACPFERSGSIVIHTTNGPRFDYDDQTWTIEWPLADERGWQFFRLTEGTLAQRIVDEAKARAVKPASLRFDYKAYRDAGFPRLSDVEGLKGKALWLKVSVLRVATAVGDREAMVIAGLTDEGEIIDSDLVDRLFLVSGAGAGGLPGGLPQARIAELENEARAKKLAEAEEENRRWLNEETDKLDAYADDLEKVEEIRVRELGEAIKAAKRALRGNAGLPLDQKVAEQRRIKKLEEERDELKFTTFQRQKAIRAEMDARLDEIAKSLAITPSLTPILTIRWEMIA